MHPSHLGVLFPLNPGVGGDHQISLRPEQALSQSQLIRKTSSRNSHPVVQSLAR